MFIGLVFISKFAIFDVRCFGVGEIVGFGRIMNKLNWIGVKGFINVNYSRL